jgi:hypothetical protein
MSRLYVAVITLKGNFPLRTRRTKSRRALIAVRGVKPRRVGVIFTEIRMSAIDAVDGSSTGT